MTHAIGKNIGSSPDNPSPTTEKGNGSAELTAADLRRAAEEGERLDAEQDNRLKEAINNKSLANPLEATPGAWKKAWDEAEAQEKRMADEIAAAEERRKGKR